MSKERSKAETGFIGPHLFTYEEVIGSPAWEERTRNHHIGNIENDKKYFKLVNKKRTREFYAYKGRRSPTTEDRGCTYTMISLNAYVNESWWTLPNPHYRGKLFCVYKKAYDNGEIKTTVRFNALSALNSGVSWFPSGYDEDGTKIKNTGNVGSGFERVRPLAENAGFRLLEEYPDRVDISAVVRTFIEQVKQGNFRDPMPRLRLQIV